MIVEKIQNENGSFGPNIPEGLEYKLATYRSATDDYLLTFAEGKDPNEITCLQGRRELKARGLFDAVEAAVLSSGDDEFISMFTNLAVKWYYDTPQVVALAQQLNVDLDDFFAKAKQQKARL